MQNQEFTGSQPVLEAEVLRQETDTRPCSQIPERRPSRLALPEVGAINPTSILIEVVFPAPFGPRNPNTSPCWICRVRLFTAALSPNTFLNSCVSMAGASGIRFHYCRLLAIWMACCELGAQAADCVDDTILDPNQYILGCIIGRPLD